jgi:hypothetical protein
MSRRGYVTFEHRERNEGINDRKALQKKKKNPVLMYEEDAPRKSKVDKRW